MRLKDIFYKDLIIVSKEDSSIKPEINDFVLRTLSVFRTLNDEDLEIAKNFIGQALDSYEQEGMKEDFMPFFEDNLKELPGAINNLIEVWKGEKFEIAKEIIRNHGYMLRFHPKWDEIIGYDFYCVASIIDGLTIEDEIDYRNNTIENWEQLKKTIRSNDYDGVDLNPDIYKKVLDDLIFAYGEINNEPKQTAIEVIRSHYIPIKNKLTDYPNIHTWMRITSYVMELISVMSQQYKKECDKTNEKE